MDKLILVCYVERHVLVPGNESHITHLKNVVKNGLEEKGIEAAIFIVPTEGEMRLECINPQHVTKEMYDEILKNLEEIKKKYHVKS